MMLENVEKHPRERKLGFLRDLRIRHNIYCAIKDTWKDAPQFRTLVFGNSAKLTS